MFYSVTDKKVDHMGQIDELTLLNDFCSLLHSRFCLVFAWEERCGTFVLCELNKDKITLILGTGVFFCVSMRDRDLIKST